MNSAIKCFEATHRFFKNVEPVRFTERNPPGWLAHEANIWLWEGRVKELTPGMSTYTDFWIITRIS